MSRGAAPGWRGPVRLLLAASRSRVGDSWATWFLLPAAVGFSNLFFCALFEDSIRSDPAGPSLPQLLLTQGILFMLLTLVHITRTGSDILRSAIVMPATPLTRFLFAASSAAQSRVMIALLGSGVVFFLILFRHVFPAALLVAALLVLMAADVVALSALGAVAAIRRGRNPMAIAAYAALAILGIFALALLYRLPDVFRSIPPILWTAPGIAASAAGEIGTPFLAGCASLAILVAAIYLGRRFG